MCTHILRCLCADISVTVIYMYMCVLPVHIQVDTQACENACTQICVIAFCTCKYVVWSAHVHGYMLACMDHVCVV